MIARLALACGDKAVPDRPRRIDGDGLDAKDVLDIQITVRSLADADSAANSCASPGSPASRSSDFDDPKPAYGVGGEADPAVWGKRFHGNADPADFGQRPCSSRRLAEPDVRVVVPRLAPGGRGCRDGIRRYQAACVEAAAGIAEYQPAIDAYVNAKAWFDVAYRRAWQWAEETNWTA